MPFGRSKKDGDDLDSKKASLFGKRSSNSSKSNLPSSSSQAPGANPYAQAPAGNVNPYANAVNDPYAPQPPTSQFDSMSLQSRAPPSYRSNNSFPNRDEKSPAVNGGYGGGVARYPNNSPYGGGNGYGASDPYGSGASQHGGNGYGGMPRQNQDAMSNSGYGGLGRHDSQDTLATDAGRNALFGDAPVRAAQKPAEPPQQSQDSSYGNAGGYSASGGYDSTEMPGGYGSAPPRELTAEEQEEEDVMAAKQEIRFIKQQDVASTRNARRAADHAEQVGRDTLARLGQQGERIHNTERNLDMASNQNSLAAEKARELKTLNRSMFAVHVANPFTAKRREQAAVDIALEKHQRERQQAEDTRSEAYSSVERQQKNQRELRGNMTRPGQRNLAERAKYQFEADSEDDEMENEIEDNLHAIHRGAQTLNMLGKAMGDEISSQNKHLDRIAKKTDKVDDQIAVNRARLDRIR